MVGLKDKKQLHFLFLCVEIVRIYIQIEMSDFEQTRSFLHVDI